MTKEIYLLIKTKQNKTIDLLTDLNTSFLQNSRFPNNHWGSRAIYVASLVQVGSKITELCAWPWNDLDNLRLTFLQMSWFDLKCPLTLNDLDPDILYSFGDQGEFGLGKVKVSRVMCVTLNDLEMTSDNLSLTLLQILRFDLGLWPWQIFLWSCPVTWTIYSIFGENERFIPVTPNDPGWISHRIPFAESFKLYPGKMKIYFQLSCSIIYISNMIMLLHLLDLKTFRENNTFDPSDPYMTFDP